MTGCERGVCGEQKRAMTTRMSHPHTTVLLLATLAGSTYSQAAPSTVTTSVSYAGTGSNAFPYAGGVSENGRYATFEDIANNLVPNDTNNTEDVFVFDNTLRNLSRVSVSSAGAQGNGGSRGPSISADGQLIVFHSGASNLVVGDTNNYTDVFLHDQRTGVTTRISLSSSGVEGNEDSEAAVISPDGGFVTFRSRANNLVVGDTNGAEDVFVRDLRAGTTTRVSVSTGGQQGNRGSNTGSLSAYGNFVAFHSDANNLVAGDNNGCQDVFVRDTLRGTTVRASSDSQGVEGNQSSMRPSISDDGRYVLFESWASNLVTPDINGIDLFVKDLRTGLVIKVNVSSAGRQGGFYHTVGLDHSISGDGRFVTFHSQDPILVPNDTNGNEFDIFVHELPTRTTTLESRDSGGVQGDLGSVYPFISRGGRYVGFSSRATNLSSVPRVGIADCYLRDRGGPFAHVTYLDGGCATRPESPRLMANAPVLGNQVTVEGEFAPASSVGFALLSVAGPPIVLGSNCIVYLDPTVLLVQGLATNGVGSWSFPLSIPYAPRLAGLGLAMQGVFLGAGPLGIELTNAIVLSLGF